MAEDQQTRSSASDDPAHVPLTDRKMTFADAGELHESSGEQLHGADSPLDGYSPRAEAAAGGEAVADGSGAAVAAALVEASGGGAADATAAAATTPPKKGPEAAKSPASGAQAAARKPRKDEVKEGIFSADVKSAGAAVGVALPLCLVPGASRTFLTPLPLQRRSATSTRPRWAAF